MEQRVEATLEILQTVREQTLKRPEIRIAGYLSSDSSFVNPLRSGETISMIKSDGQVCAELNLTDDEQELLDNLKDNYGLDADPTDVERMDVPEKFNIGLRAGERRYFIKCCGDGGPQTEHERFRLAVQTYLLDRNFSMPGIHATVEGDRLLEWRDRKYILYDYVGEAYDPRKATEQLAAAAEALRRLHTLTSTSGLTGWWWDYDPKLRFPVDFMSYRRRQLQQSILSPASAKRLAECLDDMDTLLEEAINRLLDADWYSLPHIPLHGDYGQHNCRFSGTDLAAVVDWDMARMSPRIMEVAYAMNLALGPGASLRFAGAEHLELVMPEEADIARWIASYRRFAPAFGDKEATLFPLVCAAVWPMWGHPHVDEARVDKCELVPDYMRRFLRDPEMVTALLR